MDKLVKGRLYTLIGAIAWGLSGACGQYLMNDSAVSPIYLTALRMMIAGLVLTLFAYWKQPKQFREVVKSPKTMGKMLFFGIFGLMLCQLTYLIAIHSSNAGTATVLQYTCPILIVIYVSLKEKTVPTVMEFVAIFFALVGTFVIATHGNPFNLSLTPAGLFWGIISAFTYALYTLLPGKLIQQLGSLIVTGLGLLSGGILFYIGSASWQYDSMETLYIHGLYRNYWNRNNFCLYIVFRRSFNHWTSSRKFISFCRTNFFSILFNYFIRRSIPRN